MNIQELEHIKRNMSSMNFVFLDNNISDGKVMNIILCGDLNLDGFEFGYLILPKGSFIRRHTHNNDVERYKVLAGKLCINGINNSINVCLLNRSHNIDAVEDTTIVQFCKINRLYYPNLEDISICEFDKIEQRCLIELDNEKSNNNKFIL